MKQLVMASKSFAGLYGIDLKVNSFSSALRRRMQMLVPSFVASAQARPAMSSPPGAVLDDDRCRDLLQFVAKRTDEDVAGAPALLAVMTRIGLVW